MVRGIDEVESAIAVEREGGVMRKTLVCMGILICLLMVAAFAAGPNDSAFPRARIESFGQGMTIRQWYKGMAISGLLANPYRSADSRKVTQDAATIADLLIQEDR